MGEVKHIVLAKFKDETSQSIIDDLIKGYANLVNLIQPMKSFQCSCFKAFIDDGTSKVSLTCFSPEADGLMSSDDGKVLEKVEDKYPYKCPYSLLALEETRHILQFHFSPRSRTDRFHPRQCFCRKTKLLIAGDAEPLAIRPCTTTEPYKKAVGMSSKPVQISTPPDKEDNHHAKKNTTPSIKYRLPSVRNSIMKLRQLEV